MKPCPFCANDIQDAAIKCQYCGEFLEPVKQRGPSAPPLTSTIADTAKAKPPAKSKGGKLNLLVWVGLLVVAAVAAAAQSTASYGVFVVATFCLIFLPMVRVAYGLGDKFRRFTQPTWFTTHSVMQSFWTKVFWKIGPQIISLGIAAWISGLAAAGLSVVVFPDLAKSAQGGEATVAASTAAVEESPSTPIAEVEAPAAGDAAGTAEAPAPQEAAAPAATVDGGGETIVLADIAPGPVAACMAYRSGKWVTVADEAQLRDCVGQVFAGQCESVGGATYGRWGEATIRLTSLGVEISNAGGSFRPLARSGPACSA